MKLTTIDGGEVISVKNLDGEFIPVVKEFTENVEVQFEEDVGKQKVTEEVPF